jgi:hypothetical protein
MAEEIEYECLVCFDHEYHERQYRRICSGCNNGAMRPYIKEIIKW